MESGGFECRLGRANVKKMDPEWHHDLPAQYSKAIRDRIGILGSMCKYYTCDVSAIRDNQVISCYSKDLTYSAAQKFAVLLVADGFTTQFVGYLDCLQQIIEVDYVTAADNRHIPFADIYAAVAVDTVISAHVVPIVPHQAHNTAGLITDRILSGFTNVLRRQIMAHVLSNVANQDIAVTAAEMRVVLNMLGEHMVNHGGAALKQTFSELKLD